jgi:hypothetical protein
MRLIAILSAIVITLAGCKVRTELPSEIREITLAGSPQQVICRVEAAARHSGLSFHYAHNKMDDIIAFRLIADNYEITAVNFTGKAIYDLRLYDRSEDSAGTLSAKQGFSALASYLNGNNATLCRSDS